MFRATRGIAATTAVALVLACSSGSNPGSSAVDAGVPKTFLQASDAALRTMQSLFYSQGNWRMCVPTACSGVLPLDDFDWGADSMTAALYLRWTFEKDASIVTMMKALDANGAGYGTCTDTSCLMWSDVPLWDSIAGAHEHFVTGSATSLARAKSGFDFVDTANQFALGACPEIDYQRPGGDLNLKTLETDSNYIKAALLLFQLTGSSSYLDKAVAKYASVRKYFLDPQVPLYTVYVFDDGKTCAPLAHRFYGSVNGNMIWNGLTLAADTGQSSYADDAMATAKAVNQYLGDSAGIYADLQTDDDVAEPLVEGMYLMATQGKQSFATDWLLKNATAMAGARTPEGVYGRFFDGPAPPGQITEWQANGGFALAFVAGALSPTGPASTNAGAWKDATYVADDLSTLPSSITFTGRAIAVMGTIGEKCCKVGEARVFVDGVETFDQTGIHQNQSNAFGPVPSSILFAWRWPTSGSHTLRFEAGPPDPKDGGPFLHVQGYSYVP
jgi:hypothetical protein